MAAAVQFGQMVERNWHFTPENFPNGPPDGAIVIDNNDKQTVRENLLSCLYQVWGNSKITKQYTRSLKFILRTDYPHYWPQFMDNCLHYLNNANQSSTFTDEKSLITGLTGIKNLC